MEDFNMEDFNKVYQSMYQEYRDLLSKYQKGMLNFEEKNKMWSLRMILNSIYGNFMPTI